MAILKTEHLGFENTPKSHAEFFLKFISELAAPRPKPPASQAVEYRLKKISDELIAMEQSENQAGYAVGLLYHVQNKKLEGEAKEIVKKAKDIYYEKILLANKASYQAEALSFFNHGSNESSMDLQYADLCTDNAFSALLELQTFNSISLEQFYEDKLDNYQRICKLKRDHIMLYSIDKEIENLNHEQLGTTLRKLCVTNTHSFVIESLLKKGADPHIKSQKTNENAIEIANRYNHPETATVIQNYLEKKQKSDMEI